MQTIYVENAVAHYARTRAILARFKNADVVTCEKYSEVFNPKTQNFKLQKLNPSLILAAKHGKRVLPTPKENHIGGEHNYYFSHMLNCVYDCRYCFLQGMFRSANYLVFVNYEDFFTSINQTLLQHPNEKVWFFSGYDCDSLAYEPVTKFVEQALPFFKKRPNAILELRTKSTQIRSLLKTHALPNVIVAFSLTPDDIAAKLEHGAPTIEKRLGAMRQLAEAGWQVGVRVDPLIYCEDYQQKYTELFDSIFSSIPAASLHSITYGAFRLPKPFFKNMRAMYKHEPLFAGPLDTQSSMVGYEKEIEQEMLAFCSEKLRAYVAGEKLFACTLTA